MRYKKVKKTLMFWCLFIGIGALYGSICMFIKPDGSFLHMESILSYFEVLPFSDVLFKNYIFSGIMLLLVNGITNITAFCLILKNKKIGIILGMIFGTTLMLWIIIQFIILPTNVLSISYFIFGFIEFLTGLIALIFYRQEQFNFNINDYYINKSSNTLVVYFSRMGYTKKVAYDIANSKNANILEITTTEKISGTLGFWWCGRYGMHKWRMNINKINENLKKYDKVIIVSPIWVFDLSSPVREFCYKYKDDINSYDLVLTHFMKSKFLNVKENVCKIIGKPCQNFVSICVRYGKIKDER